MIRVIAKELKQPPDQIRQWSLSDLVDMISDILNSNDTEAYSMLFSLEGK